MNLSSATGACSGALRLFASFGAFRLFGAGSSVLLGRRLQKPAKLQSRLGHRLLRESPLALSVGPGLAFQISSISNSKFQKLDYKFPIFYRYFSIIFKFSIAKYSCCSIIFLEHVSNSDKFHQNQITLSIKL